MIAPIQDRRKHEAYRPDSEATTRNQFSIHSEDMFVAVPGRQCALCSRPMWILPNPQVPLFPGELSICAKCVEAILMHVGREVNGVKATVQSYMVGGAELREAQHAARVSCENEPEPRRRKYRCCGDRMENYSDHLYCRGCGKKIFLKKSSKVYAPLPQVNQNVA